MAGLSKSRIIAHRQCPKRLWLQIYKPDVAEEQTGSVQLMASGTQAGEAAHQMFPDGILVADTDIPIALAETQTLLNTSAKCALFEAALQYDGVLIFADILAPNGKGHHLIEVKSSTRVKDYHYEDATVQAWVTKKAGIALNQVSIACIDTEFVFQGNNDYRELFYLTDITPAVFESLPEVEDWVKEARATLSGEEPHCDIGDHCHAPFDCPFLNYCSPPKADQPTYPVTDLPYGGNTVKTLVESGYEDLEEVPPRLLTNTRHQRIHSCVLSGNPFLSDKARQIVSAIGYPRYYLDFETIQFAVPIWKGTRPYQQLPFQWSCHIENEDSKLIHSEFLGQGANDPRELFVQTLVKTIGPKGPIVAYNADFERSRLKELADDFPEYSGPLKNFATRMFDLLPVARAHYYHPDMHGSWSIKNVLPTIAPELSYKGMAVADGGMAQDAYRQLIFNQLTESESQATREALLRYCEKDTLAMVRIAHHFEGK